MVNSALQSTLGGLKLLVIKFWVLPDHVGLATIPVTLPVLIEAAKKENELGSMRVVAGVELTHVRPEHIKEGVELARSLGAEVVIVHGETISEDVKAGTNRAAIEAGADILAHPGLITDEEVQLAADKGVRIGNYS